MRWDVGTPQWVNSVNGSEGAVHLLSKRPHSPLPSHERSGLAFSTAARAPSLADAHCAWLFGLVCVKERRISENERPNECLLIRHILRAYQGAQCRDRAQRATQHGMPHIQPTTSIGTHTRPDPPHPPTHLDNPQVVVQRLAGRPDVRPQGRALLLHLVVRPH